MLVDPSEFFLTTLPDKYSAERAHALNAFTAEAVDVHMALRSYTIWAARQLFLEDRRGSLEVAKDADIAVWDADPCSVAPEALKELKCELTLFQGDIVYRAKTAHVTCHLGSTAAPCWSD